MMAYHGEAIDLAVDIVDEVGAHSTDGCGSLADGLR
jgi:hypothetical protein